MNDEALLNALNERGDRAIVMKDYVRMSGRFTASELRAVLRCLEKQLGSHWEGCWEAHHECAVARVRELEQAIVLLRELVEKMALKVETRDAGAISREFGIPLEKLLEVRGA